jgi:uncharacterized OsmC-like protein
MMTTTKHLAHAVGATSATAPQWRVELQAGTHHLVADEPTNMSGGDAGPTPFGLLLCGVATCTTMTRRMFAERTPVTTSVRAGTPITPSIRAVDTPTPRPTS